MNKHFFLAIIAFLSMPFLGAQTSMRAEIFRAADWEQPVQVPVSEFTVNEVTLPGGLRLQYVEHGNERGIPVIFLHGYTDSWVSYENILKFLPENIRAFAISQRGHGDSNKPEKEFEISDMAADIAGFMEIIGLKSAVIAGHSMGGAVAIRFALDFPDKTLGLVLNSTTASFARNAMAGELGQYILEMPTVDRAFVREFQQSTIAGAVSPEYVEKVIDESMKVPLYIWKNIINALLKADYNSELGKIRARTLILWGNKDAVCSLEEQLVLRNNIRNGSFIEYNETGHALHWEHPKRFAEEVTLFILSLRK